MQSVSSRIWTRVVVSISYDDNDYTTLMMDLENICKIVSKELSSLWMILWYHSHDYLSVSQTIFADILAWRLEVCIIH